MAARTALLGALACAFLSHALAFSSFSPVAYPRPLFLQRHEGKPTCNRLAAEPRLRSTLRPLRCESTKSGVRAQMTDLLRLEAELEEAVLLENYSEAAALRDKIANLRTDSSLSVLAVNEAFYKAFRNGDSEAMDKVLSSCRLLTLILVQERRCFERNAHPKTSGWTGVGRVDMGKFIKRGTTSGTVRVLTSSNLCRQRC